MTELDPQLQARVDATRAARTGRQGQLVKGQAGVSGRHVTMTARRRKILRLIADGMQDQEIADELGVHLETVKTTVGIIFKALDARGRAHAVAIGYDLRILTPAGHDGMITP